MGVRGDCSEAPKAMMLMPKPRFSPPSATITSQDPAARNPPPAVMTEEEDLALKKAAATLVSLNCRKVKKRLSLNVGGEEEALAATKEEVKVKDLSKASVLKQFLHRYTNDQSKD